jgi:hypothetical protein
MEKLIIWYSVEKSRAKAILLAFTNNIRFLLQTPLIKMLLESIWHTFALLLVFTVVSLVFAPIFPPLLLFIYLLMYPTIIITFLVALVLIIWLRPFVSKIFDTIVAIVTAFINSRKDS